MGTAQPAAATGPWSLACMHGVVMCPTAVTKCSHAGTSMCCSGGGEGAAHACLNAPMRACLHGARLNAAAATLAAAPHLSVTMSRTAPSVEHCPSIRAKRPSNSSQTNDKK